MEPQAAFLDNHIGPNPRHQILLADDFIRRGRQGDEDVEGARAQLYGSAFSCQEPFTRSQMERAKRQIMNKKEVLNWVGSLQPEEKMVLITAGAGDIDELVNPITDLLKAK